MGTREPRARGMGGSEPGRSMVEERTKMTYGRRMCRERLKTVVRVKTAINSDNANC